MEQASISANTLRMQLSELNLARCENFAHEVTYGSARAVVYGESPAGHGNFLPASYKRICADPDWSRRLEKAYTASSRVPRSGDRRRSELECANSSDALLMNVFCYPRLLRDASFCSFLGVDLGMRPQFGVRAYISMKNDETDRTELDMCLGSLCIEAKLTETNFGKAARARLTRYAALKEVFEVGDLPWAGNVVHGYQLIRGVLAAYEKGARFALLCDGRRTDLQEMWFRVLRCVRSCEVRSQMALFTWQELASYTPRIVQTFLREKYGIIPAA